MSDLYAVAGKRLFIGGTLDAKKNDFVLADFNGQSWTEIDGWETHGQIGDSAQAITASLINRQRDIKLKGSFNAGTMENNFAILRSDVGQAALRNAVRSNKNFAFKIQGNDGEIGVGATVTMTIASPGVITQTAHGKSNGDKVILSTTGALPTGLNAGDTYYVVSAATNTYQLAATPGGSPIATTGTQSGVHSASAVGDPTNLYLIALVMSAAEQGGPTNTVQMFSSTLEVNSNIVVELADDI